MKTFNLSLRALRAAATHSAAKDVRYYLNGVCIDTLAGRIVATDGHRMFVCEGPRETEGGAQYILPSELIARVLKVKSRHDMLLTVTIDGTTVRVESPTGDSFSGTLIDGRFPEWQRVVPQKCSDELAQFNWDYLRDASRALGIFFDWKQGYRQGVLMHNGDGSAVMRSAKADEYTAFAVVMPMRTAVEATEDLEDFIACRAYGATARARAERAAAAIAEAERMGSEPEQVAA